ncbi:hypothetical protein QQZ08_007794 [Neonectria magnoliae]|uniref:SMODS and SLOG-associating 2TM effector domain-containing protein n=1 Tax=Neonectria magnoliae TaxID=2732573 RepID=A0ABR1HWP4_9HYPO
MHIVDTVSELRTQWGNPSDVSAVLMIIGGDVVRTALAQSTGTWFTPVCFSFGWVAYSFIALIGVLGDGKLLPNPDYPVKVFNLNSGYMRENKNWVIGRILRDQVARTSRASTHDEGIRISIFEALHRPDQDSWTTFHHSKLHLFGAAIMVFQFIVAIIPVIINRDWSIILVTGVGTLLVLVHGALPQWTTEKLPNRQHANFVFALTSGNGSQDIMVIIGQGRSLNLEELAASDTPRNGRPWQKFQKRLYTEERVGPEGKPLDHRTGTKLRNAKELNGLPVGFWITLVNTVIQSSCSLLLLIAVAAVKTNTWYLLAVGTIGMFQNGILAAIERPSESRNLPLRELVTIERQKVMDGLMDLDCTLKDLDDNLKWGNSLRGEFFPGELREDERKWWEGDHESYNKRRNDKCDIRGTPGSFKIEGMLTGGKGDLKTNTRTPTDNTTSTGKTISTEESTSTGKITPTAKPASTASQRKSAMVDRSKPRDSSQGTQSVNWLPELPNDRVPATVRSRGLGPARGPDDFDIQEVDELRQSY